MTDISKLKLSKALSAFELADKVELDCGEFDIIIVQMAAHNDSLKAAIAKQNIANKKTSIAVNKQTLTGSEEGDVTFLAENLILGWGERSLTDDKGVEVPYSVEVMKYLLLSTGHAGKVLYSKILQAVTDEELFTIKETDIKNS